MHLVLTTPEGGELWVGGIHAAGDVEFLRRNGISCLLACASNCPVARAPRLKHLGTYDGTAVVKGDIKWFAVLALLDVVGQELRAGGRVLTACKNGAHRSATVAALLLCFLCGETPRVVMEHISRVREMCDFDSLHPDRRNFNVPLKTPRQFLEAKAVELRAAHDALETHEKMMLNTIMTPGSFQKFCLISSVNFPDSVTQSEFFMWSFPKTSKLPSYFLTWQFWFWKRCRRQARGQRQGRQDRCSWSRTQPLAVFDLNCKMWYVK